MSNAIENKHAILSPSGADRWMTCPGSVKLSKDIPGEDSEYAIEGTDHHEVAAVAIEEWLDPLTLVGRPMLSGALLTEDGANYVQKYQADTQGNVEATNASQ